MNLWNVSPEIHLPFFFFNDTATTEIYPLSLHDALPISIETAPSPHPVRTGSGRNGSCRIPRSVAGSRERPGSRPVPYRRRQDRKSTRLNSSHSQISYAVFCLKKKIERVSHASR